jgi:serine/threonine-protein kinase
MTLVEQALEQPAGAREPFLALACGGDEALHAEVVRRVRAEERMNGFLLTPITSIAARAEDVFRTGDLLSGRFRITRKIAQGGMAIVYEAWDEILEKRVALKCARHGFRERLPPEVRSATEITHPNVCRVFEIHTAHHAGLDVDFVTMEFLEGQTLSQRLKGGPLPLAEARAIADEVGAGLAEAHRRGIIHGDLKGNNVILTEGDGATRAVITDFGLARGLKAVNEGEAADAGGTPDYMAPELWRGEPVTIASDIYAFGVLLFELVHGRRPTSGEPEASARATAPRGVPRRWDRVVTRCMDPIAGRRYPSVDAVLKALAPSKRVWLAAAAIAVAAVTAVWAGGLIGGRGASQPPSVAVIPFAAEGLAGGSEYLTEGLADSLIHTLAQFPDLSVIARSSSFRFADGRTRPESIARQLRGAFLVMGRIQQVGDRLRINAELVDGVSGRQLWGNRYEIGTDGLASVDDDIARHIAEQVGARLVGGSPRVARSGARSEAYALVLRGQYQRRLYSPQSREEAIGYFEQAAAVDPQFALAHAELANTYRLLAGGGLVRAADAMPKAEASARRALGVDKDLAEAHAALADVLKDRWQWREAEDAYKAAIRLKPSLVDAHMQYAILLSVTNRYMDALNEVRTVRALDPVGLPAALHAAAVHYNGRRFDDAIAELRRAMSLDPRAPTPYMWMGMVLGGSGQYAEAIPAYREAFARGDTTAATQSFYVYSLARSGARDEAKAILERIERGEEFVPLTALAAAHAGLGEYDRTIELLQQAYAEPDPILQYLKVEAHFDSVKDRPEYSELARKIGLP